MSQVTYLLDSAHTAAHFSVRHMMISNVRGEFTKVSGKIVWDSENPANSSIEAVIDVHSINTREPQRDAHLRSADFLDAEKFPEIRFRSTKVQAVEEGLEATGDLTIHGVTRSVVLIVEGPTPETRDPWGVIRIGASATTRISRKDYGLIWNASLETGGVLVGDEVKISIEVEATKQADVASAA